MNTKELFTDSAINTVARIQNHQTLELKQLKEGLSKAHDRIDELCELLDSLKAQVEQDKVQLHEQLKKKFDALKEKELV